MRAPLVNRAASGDTTPGRCFYNASMLHELVDLYVCSSVSWGIFADETWAAHSAVPSQRQVVLATMAASVRSIRQLIGDTHVKHTPKACEGRYDMDILKARGGRSFPLQNGSVGRHRSNPRRTTVH
jgi:hypothetical protein